MIYLCKCTCPPTVLLSLRKFLESLELVFGNADWPITLANLQNDAQNLIDPDGTFLEPGVADESANWANRGALLAAYRELMAAVAKANLSSRECGDAH